MRSQDGSQDSPAYDSAQAATQALSFVHGRIAGNLRKFVQNGASKRIRGNEMGVPDSLYASGARRPDRVEPDLECFQAGHGDS